MTEVNYIGINDPIMRDAVVYGLLGIFIPLAAYKIIQPDLGITSDGVDDTGGPPVAQIEATI